MSPRENGLVVINLSIRRLVLLTAPTGNPTSAEIIALPTLLPLAVPTQVSSPQATTVMIMSQKSSATTLLTPVREPVPTSTPTQLYPAADPAIRVVTSPLTRIEMVAFKLCTTLKTCACTI